MNRVLESAKADSRKKISFALLYPYSWGANAPVRLNRPDSGLTLSRCESNFGICPKNSAHERGEP